MATLNTTTWQQAKTYVDNFLKSGNIDQSGSGAARAVDTPEVLLDCYGATNGLYNQITKKHGGNDGAIHGHTGTAGALIALLDRMPSKAQARQIAQTLLGGGSGAGYIVMSDGQHATVRRTSGCTRSDLTKYANQTGIFAGRS